jgi:SAM-dependent methyltransferase
MELDQDRIRAILSKDHSYYGGGDIPIRDDSRWALGYHNDFIARHLVSTDRIIDLGCGKGHHLIELSPCFQYGFGIDNDPVHIQMAEEAKHTQGIQNVDFLLLDFPREIARLQPESFDMVISIRGALYDTEESVQAAHSLLRPDGLLVCTEIGELHHQEAGVLFFDHFQTGESASTLQRYRNLLENNGFDVRLAADVMGKMFFPNIYLWLEYVCNIWEWLGMRLPDSDDPRIALFAERNTMASGEVMMTWHVPWIGCVKK